MKERAGVSKYKVQIATLYFWANVSPMKETKGFVTQKMPVTLTLERGSDRYEGQLFMQKETESVPTRQVHFSYSSGSW